MDETRNEHTPDPKHPEYDPPKVERVMDAGELAREVHYAGFQTFSEHS